MNKPAQLDDLDRLAYANRYYVVGTTSSGNLASGEVMLQYPVRTIADVTYMRDLLARQCGLSPDSVIVTNWQRFEDHAPAEKAGA